MTPSLTVGLIKGGTKVNIVPDNCVMDIDRRVIPEEKKINAIEEFKQILNEFEGKDKDFSYNLLIGGSHDSFRTPEDIMLINALQSSYEQVKQEKCSIYGGLGCYDAAHASKHGISTAVFGTSRTTESNVHGTDERARISDIVNFGNIIERTVLKLLE